MGDKPDCKTEAVWWEQTKKKYSYAGLATINGVEYRVYAYLKEEKPKAVEPPAEGENVPF